MEKTRWSNPPTSSEDLKLLVRKVEAAKNRLSDRSRCSPVQRMIGETPKPTGELLSDAMVEPALLGEGPEMERKLAARKAAQKAFAEVNNSVALRRAMRARTRTQRSFHPGELVFVWRSWRSQGAR